jgi:hypothetical protein
MGHHHDVCLAVAVGYRPIGFRLANFPRVLLDIDEQMEIRSRSR